MTPEITVGREIRLVARPRGWPRAEDFQLVEVPLPAPGEGQVLVRNLFDGDNTGKMIVALQ
jgi:NADPH-dependent curcumin reductase CurA